MSSVTVVNKRTGYIETVPETYFEALKSEFRIAKDEDLAQARAAALAALDAPQAEAPAEVTDEQEG